MNKELIKEAIKDKINSLYNKIDNNHYLIWKSPKLKERLENQNEKIKKLIKQYEEELDKIEEIEYEETSLS
ncbi:hypothetical protein HMPREF1143_1733 [Peptoanaerobacter stomatis]|uniref:Uncharacterized protein n=1 Tax=Peptoanaerobacter stomatis TaxID=796937 RepID=J6HBU5_9FIRM|nr:hypothetical protein [Peptoanaerobacter stomatis]EJU22585.1 hypothetical protein HMPREF1143_1733 [Peptoanaerobacter stomatis]